MSYFTYERVKVMTVRMQFNCVVVFNFIKLHSKSDSPYLIRCQGTAGFIYSHKDCSVYDSMTVSKRGLVRHVKSLQVIDHMKSIMSLNIRSRFHLCGCVSILSVWRNAGLRNPNSNKLIMRSNFLVYRKTLF